MILGPATCSAFLPECGSSHYLPILPLCWTSGLLGYDCISMRYMTYATITSLCLSCCFKCPSTMTVPIRLCWAWLQQELDPHGKFHSMSNVWLWEATSKKGEQVSFTSCCNADGFDKSKCVCANRTVPESCEMGLPS